MPDADSAAERAEAMAVAEQVHAGTDAIVLLGEIGGQAEIRAAERVARMGKPVIAYVAGRWAPQGKRMGHAGVRLVEEPH